MRIESSAEYWLGNPEGAYFKAVERAIEKEWDMKPLYIREGGSIPAVRFLEKFCNAPAVHLPMGQVWERKGEKGILLCNDRWHAYIYPSTKASDQAHLHNERIRLRNLNAGRRIIKTLLQDLGRHDLLSSQ